MAPARVVLLLLVAVGLASPAVSGPQTKNPPTGYRSIEVTFSGAGGASIAGTLTVPDTPVAAVVLLPGSGAADRDAGPLAAAVDYLARRNIASLRTDSRGVGKSSGSYFEATGETLAADAIAGIELLRSRAETRAVPTGLLGHSLGATIAAIAAARSPRVAFVVLLSSAGRPDLENATERVAAQLRESGTSAGDIDAVLATLRKVTTNPDAPDLKADLLALTKITAAGVVPADQLDAIVDQQVTAMRSPWGRYFGSFDPRMALGKVRCPVLALSGSLDRILPPGANLGEIHQALVAGGNQDTTVIEMRGINHWLQGARTGWPAELSQIQEAISPRVLALVAGWLRAHAVS